MILRKRLFVFISLICCAVKLFALRLEPDLSNLFRLSVPVFENPAVEALDQNIVLENDWIQIDYVIKNNSDSSLTLPVFFSFKPMPSDRAVIDICVPFEFTLKLDDKTIPFVVKYDGQTVAQENYFSEGAYRNESKINFEVKMQPKQNHKISIKYKGSNGWSFVGNFIYKIPLLKNPDGKSAKYNFKIVSTKELYLARNNIEQKILRTSENTWECSNFTLKPGEDYPDEEVFLSCLLNNLFGSEDTIYLTKDYENNKLMLFFLEKNLSENYIDEDLLYVMNKNQLRYLRNAFYLLHGYDFKSQDLKDFFSEFINLRDYKVNLNFSEADFNEFERENIRRIKKSEAEWDKK